MSEQSSATTTTTTTASKPKAVQDFGVAEDRNKSKRRKMEDAHIQIDAFGDDEHSAFFGVYDGHSGKDAATFCSEKLHTVIF
jgi:serine/threonine protein phosphatase PrpC